MTFIKPSDSIQMSLFPQSKSSTEVADFVAPKTYTGLAGFSKKWGKKTIGNMGYLF